MNIVGIDMGKYKSYVVVEKDGTVVREGYTETTREGITSSLLDIEDPTVVVESCSILDWVATILRGYRIVAAHPSQVHMITHSNKKTDKNDAHTLIDLYKCGHLPTSWIPPEELRRVRDLCRARRFLVSKRTSIKNKIRDIAFRTGMDFERFNKRTLDRLGASSELLSVFVSALKGLEGEIHHVDTVIAKEMQCNNYAKLVKTIPGFGDYSSLTIAAEIGDVNRFRNEDKMCAYAGMVQRIYQSGNIERKGHLIKQCDNFIKYLLIECITIHVNRCGRCFICRNYRFKKHTQGTKTARVSAARKMLKVIYYMLKGNQDFGSYLRGREVRQWNSTALRSSLDCAPLPIDRSKIAALQPIGDYQMI